MSLIDGPSRVVRYQIKDALSMIGFHSTSYLSWSCKVGMSLPFENYLLNEILGYNSSYVFELGVLEGHWGSGVRRTDLIKTGRPNLYDHKTDPEDRI